MHLKTNIATAFQFLNVQYYLELQVWFSMQQQKNQKIKFPLLFSY